MYLDDEGLVVGMRAECVAFLAHNGAHGQHRCVAKLGAMATAQQSKRQLRGIYLHATGSAAHSPMSARHPLPRPKPIRTIGDTRYFGDPSALYSSKPPILAGAAAGMMLRGTRDATCPTRRMPRACIFFVWRDARLRRTSALHRSAAMADSVAHAKNAAASPFRNTRASSSADGRQNAHDSASTPPLCMVGAPSAVRFTQKHGRQELPNCCQSM